MHPIRTAAVLGAGVMGSGIAAHLANAGIPVLLLDIVPPDAGADRDRLARLGLEKAEKAKPALFYHGSRARLVRVGNLEDDLGELARCDLVVEAVLEKLDVKRALFERLEKTVGSDAIISSNTSGLPIAELVAGRGHDFRRRFLVTHFFNPVRYMKLLELVAGPDTDPEVFARVRHLGERVLGKGVVIGKDTPNFVGNRIGAYAMMVAIHQMLKDGLLPEDVDAVCGEPLGRPKSAAFRTADMVGLDTLVHVVDNCHAALPGDESRDAFLVPDYMRRMVEARRLGDKSGGGFYRKTPGGIETLDPKTGEYRAKTTTPAIATALKALKGLEAGARAKRLLADAGPAGAFAWRVTAPVLAYAARRVGEICDELSAIDDAMRWGYNWELGPFELWDALGFEETCARMDRDGVALPAWITAMRAAKASGFYHEGEVWDARAAALTSRPVAPRTATLAQLRAGERPVLKTAGGVMTDVGDGVAAVTFASKANTIDPDVISLVEAAVARAEADFRGLIIYNEGEHFCLGANLGLVAIAAGQKDWKRLGEIVDRFQGMNQRLRYASVPVVAAPYSYTFGGGLEICLGAAGVQAAAETYAGPVEVGVGVIPAGAGCLNLLWRALEGVPEGAKVDTQALVVQIFTNVALARVATSAEEAKALGYFRHGDGVSFDKATLLHDAKAHVLGLAGAGYHPPAPRAHVLPGRSGIATLEVMVAALRQGGQATDHDALIAGKLARVLCGGESGAAAPVTEDRILELEREAFLSLCGEEKSQKRMQHMLLNNKPLRN